MQIRTKLTLQFSLLVGAIMLVSFVAIYYFSLKNTEEDFFDRLKSKAVGTASLLLKVKEIDNELLRIIDGTNRDQIFNDQMFIFDEKNRLIYTNMQSYTDPVVHVSNFWLDEIRRSGEIRYTDGDYKVVGLYYKYPFNRSVVLFAGQDLYGKANLSNLRTVLLVIFCFVIAIVALVGWFFSQRALKPISKVMNELEGILPQKLDVRLKAADNADEIGRLTTTFNQLLDRIEYAFRLQKTFVANVSHELKNPLTKMRSQLEVSLLKDRDVDVYKETISSVLDDIRDLSTLSSSLLELAKVSEDRRDLLTESARIDEILLDVRSDLLKVKKYYTINLEFLELPEDDKYLEINGNISLLRIALQNVIENGCKFSRDNKVTVTFQANEKGIILQFIDKGKGIPESDKAMIFQPFFRSDSTAANVKGYGIGLSLVERIVRLHGGTITLDSVENEGTTFTLVFFK